MGGWSLYAKGGKLKYCYNLFGVQYFYAESRSTLPPGDHQVRMEFAYAGGGLGKGGTASLYVDGKKVGEGKVGATEPMVKGVLLAIAEDAVSLDHLVSPEEAIRIALARQ